MTPFEIMDALTQVPHLQLDVPVDIETLKAEVNATGQDYVPFETGAVPNNWLNLDVCGVVDYRSDPKFAGESTFRFLKPAEMGHAKATPTGLGANMPYTTNLIYEIGENPERCRLSRLKANHTVPWHDHMQKHRYNHIVIHVPIVTNEKVEFSIRGENKIGYQKHYAAGTVWLLNTWVEHAVFNDSHEDRTHLWLNYYLLDKAGITIVNQKLLNIIEKALDKYDGVLIRKVVK